MRFQRSWTEGGGQRWSAERFSRLSDCTFSPAIIKFLMTFLPWCMRVTWASTRFKMPMALSSSTTQGLKVGSPLLVSTCGSGKCPMERRKQLIWRGVGRGLQDKLSLLAYRVFQDALLRATETTPLSYDVHATLALYSTKIDILWTLCKGLARYGN